MKVPKELERFWPQLLFLILAVAWFFRARYFTYYGIGVYSFVDIFLVVILALLVLRLLLKRAWKSAWQGAWIAGSLLTLLHLSVNIVTKYRPTYDLIIHPEAEGCIYLFVSTLTEDDAPFQIDSNGIGYEPRGGQFEIEFTYRGEDITNEWSHSQSQNLTIYNADSTVKTAYYLQCLNLNPEDYDQGPNPYHFIGCINEDLFQAYIDLGWVLPELLYRRTWIKRGPQYDWEYAPSLSSADKKRF